MKIVPKPSREGRKALRALREAVADAIEEHRLLGLPIAVMKNGKAVLIPANLIKRRRILRRKK